jgi:hypothetical protein
MSEARIAWGTQAAWDNATPEFRALFDDHELSLGAAVGNLPGSPTLDRYRLIGISNTDNSSAVLLPTNFAGKDISLEGGGYLYTSNYNGEDINFRTTNASDGLSVMGFRVNFNTAKNATTPEYSPFVRSEGNAANTIYIHDNFVYSALGTGSIYYQYTGVLNTAYVYNNIGIGLLRGINCYLAGDIVYAYNNTIYDCVDGLRNFGGTIIAKNNNLTGNTTCINGAYTDNGGNATSDATGSPGYQNITATDAMNDPVNGDYRPKAPLAVTYAVSPITGHNKYYDKTFITESNSYAGAFGIASQASDGLANYKQKRKIIIT